MRENTAVLLWKKVHAHSCTFQTFINCYNILQSLLVVSISISIVTPKLFTGSSNRILQYHNRGFCSGNFHQTITQISTETLSYIFMAGLLVFLSIPLVTFKVCHVLSISHKVYDIAVAWSVHKVYFSAMNRMTYNSFIHYDTLYTYSSKEAHKHHY